MAALVLPPPCFSADDDTHTLRTDEATLEALLTGFGDLDPALVDPARVLVELADLAATRPRALGGAADVAAPRAWLLDLLVSLATATGAIELEDLSDPDRRVAAWSSAATGGVVVALRAPTEGVALHHLARPAAIDAVVDAVRDGVGPEHDDVTGHHLDGRAIGRVIERLAAGDSPGALAEVGTGSSLNAAELRFLLVVLEGEGTAWRLTRRRRGVTDEDVAVVIDAGGHRLWAAGSPNGQTRWTVEALDPPGLHRRLDRLLTASPTPVPS